MNFPTAPCGSCGQTGDTPFFVPAREEACVSRATLRRREFIHTFEKKRRAFGRTLIDSCSTRFCGELTTVRRDSAESKTPHQLRGCFFILYRPFFGISKS